jgi:tetratricopeptide (TPR) repeat protein
MGALRLECALVALLLVGVAGAAEPGPRVAAVVLPTRRFDLRALSERARRVARLLAQHLAGVESSAAGPSPRRSELQARLGRARVLFSSGTLDQAAALLDAALEDGARWPESVEDPAALVGARVMRASIALARGERKRAVELIDRVIEDDPGFALLPEEARPALRAVVGEARERRGAARSIGADAVASACQAADVLVAVRAVDRNRIELYRFDGCRPIAETASAGPAGDRAAAVALGASPYRRGGPPPATSADAIARARAHYETGVGLYHLADYSGAVREFAAGYELSAKPEFLINIAQAYRGLGDSARARASYEKFLGTAPADHARRAEVRRLLAELPAEAPAALAPSALPGEPPAARAAPLVAQPAPLARTAPERRSRRTLVIAILVTVGVVLAAGAVVAGIYLTPPSHPLPANGTVTVPN